MNKEDYAKKLHADGYSCSQCVLMALSDELGIDQDTAAKLGAGMGAGLAIGEICGAASAMAIAEGLRQNDTTANSKLKVMPDVGKLMKEFARPFNGHIRCRDLKGKCGISCNELIIRAIQLID
ncbi:MAG: C-GCAxxG-C-C family protein [Roseburia sp.]|nr:C-GCAxxG-C-C family protein [Roseburia sp.]